MIIERKVGDLSVDPNVQRTMKKSRVENMANDFHPEALGVLTTSFRSAGMICIVDGQHRYRAAEMAGYQGTIETKEYRGLSLSQEAALFRLLNKTEKVSPIDQFLVACVEGDKAAVQLARYLDDNHWTVASSARKGSLSAIRSLERVYALKPEAAGQTLAVITAAYGHEPDAVQGSMLEGLGKMLAKYGDDVDLTDLAKRLSGYPGGVNGLLGRARGLKVSQTGNLSAQVARCLVDLYNRGRRTTKLANW
jgi:hypothetical protein